MTPVQDKWLFSFDLKNLALCVSLCVCVVQKADDREKRQEAHRFHFDAMWRNEAASWETILSHPPAHASHLTTLSSSHVFTQTHFKGQ